MSDEYDNNKSYQAQSSEMMDGSTGSVNPDIDYGEMGILPRCKSNWCSIFFNCGFYWSSWINFILVNETSTRFSRVSWFHDCRTLLSIRNHAWNDNGSLFFNRTISWRLW